MNCIPASHSVVLSPVDLPMGESTGQRRGSRVYQLFPEATMATESDSGSSSEETRYRRERLPSIVLEPTEQSDGESRELCWTPQCYTGNEEEEDSSAEQTEASVGGDQQEEMGSEETPVVRKSSIGPAQSQMMFSRLTPPPSPTTPEHARPYQRS